MPETIVFRVDAQAKAAMSRGTAIRQPLGLLYAVLAALSAGALVVLLARYGNPAALFLDGIEAFAYGGDDDAALLGALVPAAELALIIVALMFFGSIRTLDRQSEKLRLDEEMRLDGNVLAYSYRDSSKFSTVRHNRPMAAHPHNRMMVVADLARCRASYDSKLRVLWLRPIDAGALRWSSVHDSRTEVFPPLEEFERADEAWTWPYFEPDLLEAVRGRAASFEVVR